MTCRKSHYNHAVQSCNLACQQVVEREGARRGDGEFVDEEGRCGRIGEGSGRGEVGGCSEWEHRSWRLLAVNFEKKEMRK